MAEIATPRFITIEGVEGAGKSTAVKGVCAFLEKMQRRYILTREPGGTPIAEEIRRVLLQSHDEPMSADTELLLMFAGRAQNIAEVIKPALAAGRWVISDRFTDASFAYQGGGREIDFRHIDKLATWVQADLKPDLTLLLDLPVAQGLQRIEGRGAKDRIEQEGLAFFERVRAAYLACHQREPERVVVIDAARSPEQVLADIQAVLLQRFFS
jgi:dTMP kinase